jgi:shikimate dehydrogenase
LVKISNYGIIQYPRKKTLSEVFFNKYFELFDKNSKYVGLNLNRENYDKYMDKILKNTRGLNITNPYKIKIMEKLNHIDSDAKKVGAVNCVIDYKGYNTDWIGFYKSVEGEELFDDITLFGAGGAARAVIYALIKLGAKQINIVNRTMSKIDELKELYPEIKINSFSIEKLDEILPKTDTFINCTPLGLKNEEIISSFSEKNKFIYDVNYKETPLIEKARYNDLRYKNGIDFWKYQAIENMKIWGLYDEDKFNSVFEWLKNKM